MSLSAQTDKAATSLTDNPLPVTELDGSDHSPSNQSEPVREVGSDTNAGPEGSQEQQQTSPAAPTTRGHGAPEVISTGSADPEKSQALDNSGNDDAQDAGVAAEREKHIHDLYVAALAEAAALDQEADRAERDREKAEKKRKEIDRKHDEACWSLIAKIRAIDELFGNDDDAARERWLDERGAKKHGNAKDPASSRFAKAFASKTTSPETTSQRAMALWVLRMRNVSSQNVLAELGKPEPFGKNGEMKTGLRKMAAIFRKQGPKRPRKAKEPAEAPKAKEDDSEVQPEVRSEVVENWLAEGKLEARMGDRPARIRVEQTDDKVTLIVEPT